jgi:hypothetical protein
MSLFFSRIEVERFAVGDLLPNSRCGSSGMDDV